MRKRTLSLALSGIAGALTGAVAVFLLLAALGYQDEPAPESTATPTASPSVAVSSPTVSPSPPSAASSPEPSAPFGAVRNPEGGYQFSLPPGYRVALEITALERSQVPATAALTITKGAREEEQQYVRLIEQLRRDQTATEAPVFLPGKTMTMSRPTGPSFEDSDGKLARSKEILTTKAGFSGTRYRRVEGLFTYDTTYIRFPDGKAVAVQMSYAPEEPLFDESAYQAVLDSLKPL
jgi:hypothetical protein